MKFLCSQNGHFATPSQDSENKGVRPWAIDKKVIELFEKAATSEEIIEYLNKHYPECWYNVYFTNINTHEECCNLETFEKKVLFIDSIVVFNMDGCGDAPIIVLYDRVCERYGDGNYADFIIVESCSSMCVTDGIYSLS